MASVSHTPLWSPRTGRPVLEDGVKPSHRPHQVPSAKTPEPLEGGAAFCLMPVGTGGPAVRLHWQPDLLGEKQWARDTASFGEGLPGKWLLFFGLV